MYVIYLSVNKHRLKGSILVRIFLAWLYRQLSTEIKGLIPSVLALKVLRIVPTRKPIIFTNVFVDDFYTFFTPPPLPQQEMTQILNKAK